MSVVTAARLAFRSLVRRRTYSVLVILILALGIGATTAIFAVVDAVLLKSLPYDRPDSLAVVFADGSARGQGAHVATTPGAFFDWRAQAGAAVESFAALRNVSPRITSLDTPVVPLTHAVTANYFDLLGSKPLLGRGFLAGEDAPGKDDVVVMSYGLWQSKYGGDRAIVGRTIDLDGRPYTVIGVMPRDFYSAHIFNVQPDLFIPQSFEREREDRSSRDLLVYARLRPGQSVAATQAALKTVAARIAAAHPATEKGWSVALVPLREHAVGGFTRIAATALAAVALVLLIACANVANLALARGAERSGEVAIRSALGAGVGRIAGELLIESLMLSAVGGAAGALLAVFGIPALLHFIPASAGVPFLDRASVDVRVLLFALVASVGCAVFASVLPAREAGRVDVVEGLRGAGRGSPMAAARRWRQLLVGAEVALAVVVVSGAALMARSLVALDNVPVGFDAPRIVKLRTSLRGDALAAPAAKVAHFEELQRRLGAIPSVTSVSGVSFEPPTPAVQIAAMRLRLPGQPEDSATPPSAALRSVLPDYFETMGIPIVSGRGITRADRADTSRVAVITASMAKRYFADVDPVGRSFSVDGSRGGPLQIVGVAGDVLTAGTNPAPQPTFYVPYAQGPIAVMTVVMRVAQGDAAAPLREAERVAWSISPYTNVYAVKTMDAWLAEQNWQARFGAAVLGGFALLGAMLAATGLYAVVAYTVVQRRAEIGLRKALGASGNAIAAGITGGALRTVIAGVFAGDAAAIGLTRLLNGMLYGVAPGDPLTLAIVSLAILAVALAACAGPALAAARVDPQLALRS
jgi:putative ABC transport system permease protein